MAADGAGAAPSGVFDAAQFDSALSLQALRVPKTEVHALCAVLRRLGALFDKPRLRSVVADDATPEERLVLLHEDVHAAGAAQARGLDGRARLTQRAAAADLHGLPDAAKSLIAERGLAPEPYTLRLTYEYWTAEHVLKARSCRRRRRARMCSRRRFRHRRCCRPAPRCPARLRRLGTWRTSTCGTSCCLLSLSSAVCCWTRTRRASGPC
jgi:hypothetical protein